MGYLKSIIIDNKPEERLKKLAGLTIELNPGINFIVGENGIGKSSLLLAFSGNNKSTSVKHVTSGEKVSTCFFDTEKMNPRTKSYFDSPFDISSRFVSHGECLFQCLSHINNIEKIEDLLLIDEPESGISPWNQKKLLRGFLKLSESRQLLIATHSIIFTRSKKGRLIELNRKKIVYFDPPSSYNWRGII